MKTPFKIVYSLWIFITFFGCKEEDNDFGNIINPSNINITYEIVGADSNPFGDGSGFVNFTATADNAITYNFVYGDGFNDANTSGVASHRFSIPGINTYTVVVNATGVGGAQSSASVSFDLFSSFDDQEAKALLTGAPTTTGPNDQVTLNEIPAGTTYSKTWYWDSAATAHLGVGPATPEIGADGFYYPQWYQASPFEKETEGCVYDDVFVFEISEGNILSFQHNNQGASYFNSAHAAAGGGTAGGGDACLDFDTSTISAVVLAPSAVPWDEVPDPDFTARGTIMNFSNSGFMGYYAGASSYDIISITETELYVRFYDSLDPALAWYQKFTTELETTEPEPTTLVWSDEFDVDGAPDPSKWTYDIGTGGNGWGNNESQYYTDRTDNVEVLNGSLVITAQAESYMGSNYTSARLKSQGLYDFTYGKVEISAKLPEGSGTWPALWMLGSNFDTVGWPTCGEIDIMEHVGNNQNTISAALHSDAASGGNAITNNTLISNASTEFHTYTLLWNASTIKISVDDSEYFVFANDGTTPFNDSFFFILNIAMGGNLGGTIDPAFISSSMEVDYIRVYQ